MARLSRPPQPTNQHAPDGAHIHNILPGGHDPLDLQSQQTGTLHGIYLRLGTKHDVHVWCGAPPSPCSSLRRVEGWLAIRLTGIKGVRLENKAANPAAARQLPRQMHTAGLGIAHGSRLAWQPYVFQLQYCQKMFKRSPIPLKDKH